VSKPTKTEIVKPIAAVKKIVLEEPGLENTDNEVEKFERIGRCALGERNANAVVRPTEVVVSSTPKKSKRGKKAVARQEDSKPEVQPVLEASMAVILGKDGDTGKLIENVGEVKKKSRSMRKETDVKTTDADAEALKQAKLKRREAKAAKKERLRIAEQALEQETPPVASDDILKTPSEEPHPPPRPELSDPYETHCSPLLNLSPHPITPFSTWSNALSSHFTITKIAEASFGEVYRLALLSPLPDFDKSQESVFKIIALQPPPSTLPPKKDKKKRAAALKKSEMMSAPLDVANEVKLLQRMSSIPGFTNFRDIRVLQGRPPGAFIEAFRAFNTLQERKSKDLSHFPDPSKKANYAADQLWAIIEMQDAGTDLEQLIESAEKSCGRIWEVWDVFWQVVLSLAKGEEGAEFEHRDLHLGNICVRRPQGKQEAVDVKKKLGFTGLETTIIDYTISRCQLQDGTTAFLDLERDMALFEGDSTEEYQYDIYRYMRGVMFLDSAYSFPTEEEVKDSGRNWEQFQPGTNLVWLHFVLYGLLEGMEWVGGKRGPKAKKTREVWKRGCELEGVLGRVQEMLDPGSIGGEAGVASARDLVLMAVEEGWLDLGDVVGENGVDDEEVLAREMEALEV
jgi:serine/threonine-protein kinase haspin